jgi:hypothetical protein
MKTVKYFAMEYGVQRIQKLGHFLSDYKLRKPMWALQNISGLPPLSAKTGLQNFSEFRKYAANNPTDYKTEIDFVRFTKTER